MSNEEKKLLNYLNSWENKKIITKKQKNLMMEDMKNETSTNNFFKIIAIIGSIFIGLGVLLLISVNWADLPKFVKLILILFMPIISIGGGYYLSYVKIDYKKIGDSFIFLGSFLIGASLALLAQLYSTGGSVGKLFLIWFFLSIPLTFLFRFKSLSFLTILIFYLSIFFYIIDEYIKIDENKIILLFSILSVIIITSSFFIRKKLNDKFSNILKIFEIISIKVLLLSLFIGIVDEVFYFFGDSIGSEIFQNFIFLAIVFFIMWFSNKNYNSVLRNSTFFWLGAFMILKYFSWFWSYLDVGIFFILFGGFLILLVFGYIKAIKYFKK